MLKNEMVTDLLNDSIVGLLKDVLKICIKNPRQTGFILKILKSQKAALNKRSFHVKDNFAVPPFMILSITDACNLKCTGCYAKVNNRNNKDIMDKGLINRILQEADEIGINIILLAGGEPLVRKADIFEFVKYFKNILFPLFTNGVLLEDDDIGYLKAHKNLIPILSIEGFEEETDNRRGKGVYQKLDSLFQTLKKNNIFYGTSITVTKENYDLVTSDIFVKNLVEAGCGIFFYVEYVPVDDEADNLVLSEKQKLNITNTMSILEKKYSGVFVAFPGNEEAFGGCLAAGRGFVHINSAGDLEPCPFVPYSDTNIRDKHLLDSLKSQFLSRIKQNHSMLTETKGGCALWENRELLKRLL